MKTIFLLSSLLLLLPAIVRADSMVCVSCSPNVIDGRVVGPVVCESVAPKDLTPSFMGGLPSNQGAINSQGSGYYGSSSSGSSGGYSGNTIATPDVYRTYSADFGGSGASKSGSFNRSVETPSSSAPDYGNHIDLNPYKDVPISPVQMSRDQMQLQQLGMAMYAMRAQFQQNIMQHYRDKQNAVNGTYAAQTAEYDRVQGVQLASYKSQVDLGGVLGYIRQGVGGFQSHDATTEAPWMNAFRLKVEAKLTSDAATEFGENARNALNAISVSVRTTPIASEVYSAMGAMGVVVAADLAYGDGLFGEGSELLDLSTWDLGLSLVPGAIGATNDFSQILFGLVTGHDYTGIKMEGMDYLFRGLGVALSLSPFTKPAIVFGKVLLTQSFFEGVKFLRTLRLSSSTFSSLRNGGRSAVGVAKVVGELIVPKLKKGDLSFQEAKTFSNRLLNHVSFLGKTKHAVAEEEFMRVLSASNIALEDRLSILRSFKVGSLEKVALSSKDVIYRWHDSSLDAAKYGNFFANSPVIDKAKARQLFAIPSSNSMTYLDAYKPLHELDVWVGRVAEVDGMLGGGIQVFLPVRSQEHLISVERLVSK